MSDRARHSGPWLLSGFAVGLVATAGVVLLATRLLAGPAPTEAGAPPMFEDQSGIAGIDHTYEGEFEFFVGGGVAVFDCNDDRFPDLYLPGGSGSAGLFVNQSSVGGDLSFSPLPAASTDLRDVAGAYPIDIDSDGVTDLAVLRVGANVILRGLGSCRFEPANDRWGIDGGDYWTAAFSATWEPGESLPTLAFGNYLRLRGDHARDECEDHQLMRPGIEGYDEGALSPGWCALSMLFSDWSHSGRRDLRATNDRHYYRDGEEQLWRMDPGEALSPYTEDDGWQTMQIWGMGIASQDITGDGRPEVFLTSQGDNKLQTLEDGSDSPRYEDMALALGATAHRPFIGDTTRPSTAWHAEFDDVNNDGHMDLFVTKGNVDAVPEFAMDDPNNLLIGQADGTFIEGAAAAGVLDYARSRGAALTDLNLDGSLDLIVAERREPVKVWKNRGIGTGGAGTGNWLAVGLTQPAPNVDAIGSWVEVRHEGRVAEREITIGGGHAGGELGWVHFGVGTANEVDVRVVWPDGTTGSWQHVDANTFVSIDRSSGSADAWSPLQD